MSIRILLSILSCGAAILSGPSLLAQAPAVGDGPPSPDAGLDVFTRHPRCVFRPEDDPGTGRTFEQVRRLFRHDPTMHAILSKALAVDPERQHPAANAVCWIVSGKDRFAEVAIRQMLEKPISRSGEPYYSTVWSHALAYDWLFHHPRLTDARKRTIAKKIRERIGSELDELDRTYMALWHGRNQAANGLMIASLVFSDHPGMEKGLRRAADHWLESMRALRLAGGWPEGASYWIYNRAGPFAMATDCVMTATGRDRFGDLDLKQVMRTIGLWQLYQYGPNGVFEPYGDSSGSLHLGDTGWWVVTTDYYARLSGCAALAAGGDFFRNRSPDPYGKRPYYWYAALAYDPAVRPDDARYDPLKPERWLRDALPQAMLLGRDGLGVAYFRGTWGDPNELFASFKAGDLLAHHDHYDAGNFTIQRGGNLVPQTGFYGDYYGPHRLGYQIQTVSANSILVMAPGEFSNRLTRNSRSWKWLSGGQRVISPTGFDCVDRDHFRHQLTHGPHLERAEIRAWESVDGWYDYVAADITGSYNSTRFAEEGHVAKVSLVTRQFLYLRLEQTFVVYDRVETTHRDFRPKVLLHSLSKPRSDAETVVVGSAENGILETNDRVFRSRDATGRLTVRIVAPDPSRVFKIGGPDYCFYVESDGDPSDGFDGENLTEGSGRRGDPRRVDQWRLEIEPNDASRSTRFLVLLFPRLVEDKTPLPAVRTLDSSDRARAVQVGRSVVVFSHDDRPLRKVTVSMPDDAERLLLVDAVPGATYEGHGVPWHASSEGIVRLRHVEPGVIQLRTSSLTAPPPSRW